MPGRRAQQVSVSRCQREILERIIRARQSSQAQVVRARIICYGADGLNNEQIAALLSIPRQRVSRWRRRWAESFSMLCHIEEEEGAKALSKPIDQVLCDAPRPGMPPKFSAYQVCAIIAVACENAEECGHPLSHWTPQALRLEVIKRAIVTDISVRQVGRFLKGGGSQAPPGALLGNLAG